MDTVADALIRIKNGYMARKDTVDLPYSKMVLVISKLLVKEGYLEDAKDNKGKISATLKYQVEANAPSKRKPALVEVQKVSKPGLRVYKGKKSLPYVLDGLGIAIVSTPKGIMTDKQARKEGVGGEIIAYIW